LKNDTKLSEKERKKEKTHKGKKEKGNKGSQFEERQLQKGKKYEQLNLK